jgi:4-amino-4-deoxy-L-arabinose transferase-like glycosyltransferase
VHVTVLVVLATVFFLARVASEPLDGDPAMYATIARTIVRTGEWTHLTFNGDPYLNKPPLHFWSNAIVFRLLGASTFTATLLPGLLGVVDVVLLYAACRGMFAGWETAFAAALVYATTPEVVHWSRGVHLETLVTFWVLLGVVAAHRSVRDPAATVLLGIAAGGGWLAKGPQGLFPVALAALLWIRDGVARRRLFSRWTLAGVALAAAAAVPWLWARATEGTGFAGAYFGGQIGDVLFGHRVLGRGPLWYLAKLVRTYWPWLPVAAAGLVLLARRWSRELGARTWLVYTALVLVVITFAVGKKSRYLFQLYPGLAVAAGAALAAVAERKPRLLAWLVAPAAAGALAVGIVGEHVSRAQAQHTREALDVAARLAGDDLVLITRATQWGEPQFGKMLGFYARPMLRACRAACDEEATPGRAIVARTDELDALLGRLAQAGLLEAGGGADAVAARTPSLALVRLPARPGTR